MRPTASGNWLRRSLCKGGAPFGLALIVLAVQEPAQGQVGRASTSKEIVGPGGVATPTPTPTPRQVSGASASAVAQPGSSRAATGKQLALYPWLEPPATPTPPPAGQAAAAAIATPTPAPVWTPEPVATPLPWDTPDPTPTPAPQQTAQPTPAPPSVVEAVTSAETSAPAPSSGGGGSSSGGSSSVALGSGIGVTMPDLDALISGPAGGTTGGGDGGGSTSTIVVVTPAPTPEPPANGGGSSTVVAATPAPAPTSAPTDFDVMRFGAIGDGTTDDTAAIQAALDAAAVAGGTVTFPQGTFLFTETLFVRGKVDLVGTSAASVIKVRMRASSWVSIGFGVKKGDVGGGSKYTWNGKVEDLMFDCGHDMNSLNIVNVFRGVGYTFNRLVFQDVYTTAIKGANNATYANGGNVRQNGTYTNLLITSQRGTEVGGEGVSVSAPGKGYTAKTFLVKNCRMVGVGDDPIAFHGECTDIDIVDNECETTDGRVYISHGRNVRIMNNRLTHQTDVGWFVNISDEINGAEQPQNILIQGNTIETPAAGGKNAYYAIRAAGVDGLAILDNVIRNRFPEKPLLNEIEVSDSYTTSKNGYQARNTRIQGNTLENGFIYLLSQTDDTSDVRNNVIRQGYIHVSRPGSYVGNLITPSDASKKLYASQTRFVGGPAKTFTGTIGTDGTLNLDQGGGAAGLDFTQDCQITNYTVALSRPLASGRFDVTPALDGKDGAKVAVLTGEQTKEQQPVTAAQVITARNARLTMKGKASAADAAGTLVTITVTYADVDGAR